MDDNKFYFSVVAIVVASLFFGFLVYVTWIRQANNLVTASDIQKARELVRRLERG